jgi:hypothetical protein
MNALGVLRVRFFLTLGVPRREAVRTKLTVPRIPIGPSFRSSLFDGSRKSAGKDVQ